MILKLDGLDGCGKSTIIKRLNKLLLRSNVKTISISEFADNRYYTDKINKVLRHQLNKNEKVFDEFEREILFTLISRHSNEFIINDLQKSYDVILVDRSHLANYAYGLALNKNYQPLYDTLLKDINIYNHKIFWIDTDIQICINRIQQKRKSLSINEKKGLEFFQLIHYNYELMFRQNKCIRIDGNKPINYIINDIMTHGNISYNKGLLNQQSPTASPFLSPE